VEETPTIEQKMAADGVSTTAPVQADYFAFEETVNVDMPDGASWVQIKALNEGERRKYLNNVNRDVRIQRTTGDAVMQLATGEERAEILKKSIVGWNFIRGGAPVPCDDKAKADFLNRANPKIVDVIYEAVQKLNPWLTQDVTVEEIDRQIDELQKLREEKVKEEEGNAS
jgi:hypothetical protein